MDRGLRTLDMGRVRFIVGLALLCSIGAAAHADSSSADRPHVHVQLVFRKAKLFPGGGDHGGLYFKLESGWHVYWKNPGDAGLPPNIHWTLPDGVTAGPLQFTAPKRLPLGPLMDYGYEDEVLYPFKLEIAKSAKPGPAVLHAKVDWLVCSSSCIPGKADLEVTQEIVAGTPSMGRDDGPGVEIWKRLAVRLPDALPSSDKAFFQPTKDGFRLTVESGRRESAAVFFPEDQDIVDNPAPQKFMATAQGFTLDLKKDANLKANPAQLRGVLELSGGRAYDIVAMPGAAVGASASATGAGGSGPAAAVTQAPATAQQAAAGSSQTSEANQQSAAPASGVAPAAAIGAASAISSSASISSGNAQKKTGLLEALGLAFVGGLLLNLMPCVFPVLFLKGLALVRSGNEERRTLRLHGLVYTAGIVASFWALVGTLLVLKAAGSTIGWGFQFQSPVVLSLMAGLLFFLGLSLAGQFEIGLTLTSAGGSLAAKQGYAGSFFTGVLAVVVATPCTAPLMGAAIGYALAQSAVVSFAVFTALALGLAAPYVALTLQPAWARLLPKPGVWMDVLKQAVAVPIFGTAIWLAWVLAQAYGANALGALLCGFLLLAVAGWFLGRWPVRRWATVVAGSVVALAVVLIVSSSSYLASPGPSTLKISFQMTPEMEAQRENNAVGQWGYWTTDEVATAEAHGHPVFVDFTASWCLSCQVNERVALTRPEVMDSFKAHGVVLLKADWTRHDEAITHALEGLGRSGVPTYALYVPGQSGAELLPEVLTPGIVTDAVDKLPKR
jgi:thiol:disulfide interchange protein/DsbC/DsbD-like thiol-disulfide interchange protein